VACIDQVVTDRFALYHADCIPIVEALPEGSIHLSIYSPPFCGLFHYSSSERDMSNCRSYEEFFVNYEFLVRDLYRVTMPGRMTAVHAMDIPREGANLNGGLIDFSGDIIRLHERLGWRYCARYCVWKEPLAVRNRTMAKGLAHKQIVEDSSKCDNAGADYLLMFRKKGENPIPIAHPTGLTRYAGAREIPHELLPFRGWKGNQIKNRYSHWIWRQYASAFWDDVRLDRVLKYKPARDPNDQAHIHPLQLDVIERAVVLWSNPGETVLTPFAGVGSELAGALMNGRRAIGAELKATYYRQAVQNLEAVCEDVPVEDQPSLFDALSDPDLEPVAATEDAS
jgi:DNA modification methylase